MKPYALAWMSALAICSASVVWSQSDGVVAPSAAPEETEQGIPVTDPVVIAKCGTCHARDETGVMTRISFARATPEGWQQAIRRMVRQNGLEITPAEARQVVKYLSARHGLAPEEARPVMYIPEKRLIDETLIPDRTVRQACASCHAFGQALSWRRSKTDWKLLQNLHVALYAQADAQYRRAVPGAPAAGRGEEGGSDRPQPRPGEVALEWLAMNAALHSPEWTAWQSRVRNPRLAGRWLVRASVPGKGRFVGDLVVEAGAAADEFKTVATLRSVVDGTTIRRTGNGLLYGGYAWRGRSKGGAPAARPDDPASEAREAMWFAPDQTRAEGRWYWGEYNEFGFDVAMTRASGRPSIQAVFPETLKAGAKAARIRIVGDGLTTDLAAADLDLGAGVKIVRIVSQKLNELVAEVDVEAQATPGMRDIELRGAVLERGYAVYDRVDYLKIAPETGVARLGSETHPKGYQQFDAIGYAVGPDGKANTSDDVRIGPIDVSWSIEEFTTVFGDDDRQFVGTLSANALFTPATDGPNPNRRFGRNNYGEVWVQATAKTERDRFGKLATGRAFMVVTVPTFIRWDQPEVSQ